MPQDRDDPDRRLRLPTRRIQPRGADGDVFDEVPDVRARHSGPRYDSAEPNKREDFPRRSRASQPYQRENRRDRAEHEWNDGSEQNASSEGQRNRRDGRWRDWDDDRNEGWDDGWDDEVGTAWDEGWNGDRASAGRNGRIDVPGKRSERAATFGSGRAEHADDRRALRAWRETTYGWAVTQRSRLLSTRRGRVTLGLLICLLVSILGGIPTTVLAYQTSGLVHDGLQHLKNAETDAKVLQKSPFDTNTLAAMRGELIAAHADFVQLNARVQGVPGMLQVLPLAGTKLVGAQHLLPIAVEATQAGITACDAFTILASALKNPLDPKGQGLTPQSTSQLTQDVDQLVAIFQTLVPQINALQPSDLSLDPRLGPAIAGFKTQLPKIEQVVQGAQALARLAPLLLGVGQPANYLVEVLDSTELRPGGGFIGNYGILTLNGGRMSDLHIQDVDLLDVDVKHGNLAIPIPSQYNWLTPIFVGAVRWGFRDSNLDADFATSAQNGENLYAQEMQYAGQKPAQLQGVIAITPWLIQNAMKITGNVDVTDYPTPGHTEVITPDNLIDKIHYYALGTYQGPDTQYDPRCGTSARKCFTGLLFKAFMAKVKQDLSGNFGKFGQLFIDSLHSKDIQIYLNPASAEKVLHQFSLDSSIAAPPSGDSLFEVDANIGGSKTNYFLTYAMADQITLNAAGDATHHLTFTYTWPPNPQSLIYNFAAGVADRYHAYSRLYLPPNVVLQRQSGWVDTGTGTAFGRKVLNGTTYVTYGAGDKQYGPPLIVSFDYTVPHAATHDASGWHYHLLMQKQAGITWLMSAQLTLPSCGSLVGKSTGFTTSSGNMVSVKEPLANDVQFGVDYGGC